MLLKTILCQFGHICATRNAFMLLETILCNFEQTYAIKNAFVGLAVDWNSILNFTAKDLSRNVQSPLMW